MMKLGWVALLLLAAMPAKAEEDGIAQCKADAGSRVCSSYLSGVVDSALLMNDRQARATFGETFSERALSNRVGERLKLSGRACQGGKPDATRLKAVLQGEFMAGKVDSVSDMYDILAAELSCQRSQRSGNVTP